MEDTEQITVTLSAKDWRVIELLSRRGSLLEINFAVNELRALEAVHELVHARIAFLAALPDELKPQPSLETAQPLPTSPTAE